MQWQQQKKHAPMAATATMATMLSMSVRNDGIVSSLDFDGTNLAGLGSGGSDGGRRYHGGDRSGRGEDQGCGDSRDSSEAILAMYAVVAAVETIYYIFIFILTIAVAATAMMMFAVVLVVPIVVVVVILSRKRNGDGTCGKNTACFSIKDKNDCCK